MSRFNRWFHFKEKCNEELKFEKIQLYILHVKLQPAIFPLSQHVIRFHELPVDTTQRFLQ